MKKSSISILITNHNKNIFLNKNLKKSLDQSYKNFEVILYDDRSTDGSIETIQKFKKINLIKNKKIIYILQLINLRGLLRHLKSLRVKLFV